LILRTALYGFSGRHGLPSGMSMIDRELDGLCPPADFDGVVLACSVDDQGAVADDVTNASVVTVAIGVVLVIVMTMVDVSSRELVVLVIIGGDAGRYGSVTRMNPGVAVTVVDVVGVVVAVGSAVATTLTDDVTVARFVDCITVEAASEASSEMTTVSWNPISSSGIAGDVMMVDVVICCCHAAISSGVSSGSTSEKRKIGGSSSTSMIQTPCSSSSESCDNSKSCATLVVGGSSGALFFLFGSSSIRIISVVVASAVLDIVSGTIVVIGHDDDVTFGSGAGNSCPSTS